MQLLQFNAHEIYETQNNGKHKFLGSKPLYIGVAIYKSAAYFNHNCYPAVVRYFVGKSIVLCASHPLEPGDVVAENYGPIFTKQILKERQRNLRSRYWFFCECICCKENWPTLDKLTNYCRLRCELLKFLWFLFRSFCVLIFYITYLFIDVQQKIVKLFMRIQRNYRRV